MTEPRLLQCHVCSSGLSMAQAMHTVDRNVDLILSDFSRATHSKSPGRPSVRLCDACAQPPGRWALSEAFRWGYQTTLESALVADPTLLEAAQAAFQLGGHTAVQRLLGQVVA